MLAPTDSLTFLRVNAHGTSEFEDDLAVAATVPIDAVVIPKAEPKAIAAVRGRLPLIALIETATGLENAAQVASDPRVALLVLGSADLATELRLESAGEELELLYPRARLATASAHAGIPPPIDGVHLDLDDDDALTAASTRARALGFQGKSCVHPRQVPIVNRVFSPTADQIARARRIVEAYDAIETTGSIVVDGRLVDRPVVEQAQALLVLARQLERDEGD